MESRPSLPAMPEGALLLAVLCFCKGLGSSCIPAALLWACTLHVGPHIQQGAVLRRNVAHEECKEERCDSPLCTESAQQALLLQRRHK